MRLSEEFRKRTKQYASAIVGLYVELPKSRKEVAVLGHQLLRSGTSVAAHTREASRARSGAEFCSKIAVVGRMMRLMWRGARNGAAAGSKSSTHHIFCQAV
jgi:23S rRNA-intervening sequence protein